MNLLDMGQRMKVDQESDEERLKKEGKKLKTTVTVEIHQLADALDWCHLTIPQKSKHYEIWTQDPEIGGRLAEVIGAEKVHMFIKDTVMRTYHRAKKPVLETMIHNMGLKHHEIVQSFEKPVGLLYDHTHLYTLTVAKEWRGALLSAYERATVANRTMTIKKNLLFITDHRVDRFLDESYRTLMESAGNRLDVDIQWVR